MPHAKSKGRLKTIEKWKAYAFIGCLAVTAFIINSAVQLQPRRGGEAALRNSAPRPTQLASTAERRAETVANQGPQAETQLGTNTPPDESATTRMRYMARYLNTEVGRKVGSKMVAIVASSEDRKTSTVVRDALIRKFGAPGVEILPSLFKEEFITDGLLNAAFSGSKEPVARLELTNILDTLVLSQLDVQYSKNPDLENVTTANMRLEVATFSLAQNTQTRTWTFEVNGAGFTPTAARALAEERLLKELAKDTKMTLSR